MNLDKDTKNIVVGACVGSAIGIGVISVVLLSRHLMKDKSVLHSIGSTICHLGEMIEKGTDKGECLVKDVQKQVNKHDSIIENVVEAVSVGMKLWKKIKHEI